eukprot:scaffold870_cov268-Pinguiococcus_pyrenoidosus.AAC.81
MRSTCLDDRRCNGGGRKAADGASRASTSTGKSILAKPVGQRPASLVVERASGERRRGQTDDVVRTDLLKFSAADGSDACGAVGWPGKQMATKAASHREGLDFWIWEFFLALIGAEAIVTVSKIVGRHRAKMRQMVTEGGGAASARKRCRRDAEETHNANAKVHCVPQNESKGKAQFTQDHPADEGVEEEDRIHCQHLPLLGNDLRDEHHRCSRRPDEAHHHHYHADLCRGASGVTKSRASQQRPSAPPTGMIPKPMSLNRKHTMAATVNGKTQYPRIQTD